MVPIVCLHWPYEVNGAWALTCEKGAAVSEPWNLRWRTVCMTSACKWPRPGWRAEKEICKFSESHYLTNPFHASKSVFIIFVVEWSWSISWRMILTLQGRLSPNRADLPRFLRLTLPSWGNKNQNNTSPIVKWYKSLSMQCWIAHPMWFSQPAIASREEIATCKICKSFAWWTPWKCWTLKKNIPFSAPRHWWTLQSLTAGCDCARLSAQSLLLCWEHCG